MTNENTCKNTFGFAYFFAARALQRLPGLLPYLWLPSLLSAMGKHMCPKQAALCWFYRNPPRKSGYAPQRWVDIPALVGGRPLLKVDAVKKAVRRFHKRKSKRGRPTGWRKTTPLEDKCVLKSFFRVRRPLGSAVNSREVHSALPDPLRRRICQKTVANRLAEKGYTSQEKPSVDDGDKQWRETRLAFAKFHSTKSDVQWKNRVQAVGDFHEEVFYPRALKNRHKVKSAARTIMRKGERNKAAFQKPRRYIFKRKEFKKYARKAKVFGMTTSTGQSFAMSCPANPTAKDWVRMLPRIAAFLQKELPDLTAHTILLDGEKLLHTDEAKNAMAERGLRVLPGWPSNSPDLNPQENVWAWVRTDLRKSERKSDTFPVFKRRFLHSVHQYQGKSKLVGSLSKRMALCIKKKGFNIRK